MAKEAHAFLQDRLASYGQPRTRLEALSLLQAVATDLGEDRHQTYGPNNIAMRDDPLACPHCDGLYDADPEASTALKLMGLCFRANDKLKRAMRMAAAGLDREDEPILDSAVDLVNYGLYMAMVLLDWWDLPAECPDGDAVHSRFGQTNLRYELHLDAPEARN